MSLVNDQHIQRIINLLQKVQGGVSEAKTLAQAASTAASSAQTLAQQAKTAADSAALSVSYVDVKPTISGTVASTTTSNSRFIKYGKLVIAIPAVSHYSNTFTMTSIVPVGYRISSKWLRNRSYDNIGNDYRVLGGGSYLATDNSVQWYNNNTGAYAWLTD